ncbi:hypothetical protein Corgl_1387 [Coriobacterium glomerans PW2]|uniref:Glycosyl transferase family 28 C-terminal domain-containing protein n=1 Tax=Coriobacterium glomerans (strain ATCC 49209 / DSM 20642 / JCM 10262 / PW2) TaxID=700015 RepID=F2NAN2_CORGP|nr:hypothetical protein [Coriobacterium glomerans]AEB07488.1 hypothetical protein Corgl_1387 [Coriobacterium glomerans PW2]
MKSVNGLPDRSEIIFGNVMDAKTRRRARRARNRYARRFGDDASATYHLAARDLPTIGTLLDIRELVLSESDAPLDIIADAKAGRHMLQTERSPIGSDRKPVVIGNIRMGYGHYRIAIAMASAARAMGFTPYWFDLVSHAKTTGAKVIAAQNELYSQGSRLSQRFSLFNRLIWEPLNTEGFRKLSYNAIDQKKSELMVPIFQDLPQDVPYVGTHAWPSQAAVHAGLTHVVNAIPDNWPMALHLAEGSIHAVQTPGAYLGYRMLRGMAPTRSLRQMPRKDICETGHYVDHEIVSNIDIDCARRRERLLGGSPIRYLITIGGAGAQTELVAAIIEHLLPAARRGDALLLINAGDHGKVWKRLEQLVDGLASSAVRHFGDFREVMSFADLCLAEDQTELSGIHAFFDQDIFAAVYSTNLLMRGCDLLITKPSELSFYPVPKLMVHRIGGHEAWGAIRTAELGDGTYEIDDTREVLSVIDAMQADRTLISRMCDAIIRANAQHVYDGAYRVINLATTGLG